MILDAIWQCVVGFRTVIVPVISSAETAEHILYMPYTDVESAVPCRFMQLCCQQVLILSLDQAGHHRIHGCRFAAVLSGLQRSTRTEQASVDNLTFCSATSLHTIVSRKQILIIIHPRYIPSFRPFWRQAASVSSARLYTFLSSSLEVIGRRVT